MSCLHSPLLFSGNAAGQSLSLSFSHTLDEWVNTPFFVVNQLSHGRILVLEDVNISFFLSQGYGVGLQDLGGMQGSKVSK